MSLKNVKQKLRQKWSIAAKFNLIYTSVSITILFIIAISLSWGLSIMMATAEKQFLLDEVLILQNIMKKTSNLHALEQEVNGVPASLKNASYKYYMSILDPTYKPVMQTIGTTKALAGAPFPQMNSYQWHKHLINWQSPQGIPYILIAAPIKLDSLRNPTLTMKMALDVSYPNKLIAVYRCYIALFFVVFVILFLILGKILSKKAFKNLHELIKETELITIAKLSNRVDHQKWPKELASLGSAFNNMLFGIESAFTKLSHCTNELAHELRIPINNLIGSTEIILSKQRQTNEYKELLESNLEEFRRLSKLTTNILFLARTEVDSLAFTSSLIDLNQEIKIVCEFFKDVAAEKNISLTYAGKEHIYGEKILIQRAFTNLIDNAIKYTNENGAIAVSINATDKHISVSIQDNGVGISEDDCEKIFNRFYKAKTSCADTSSWGLGLAIVKSIMDLHRGTITVTSEIGRGSDFTLLFPMTV